MGSTSLPSIGQLWEGRTIDGKYALLEWLGGSANHGVFVTLRQGLTRSVIKVILAEGDDADAYMAQWEASRGLSHRHLMPIFDTGRYTIDGTSMVYIVTESADRVLSQFIDERPLKPHEATNILYPIVEALSYLHAKGFVHGHVKPSNILVAGDELKLSTDHFRLAAGVPSRLGEPSPYDAPEVGVGILTPAADVWSLSITLVEALTQQRPVWDSATNTQPEIPASLPRPFSEFVPDCLRINPTARCILSDIKAKLVPPAPAQPMPSPEELAARAARPRGDAQAAPEPPDRGQPAPEPA
jgi:serine/threonine protein kinase